MLSRVIIAVSDAEFRRALTDAIESPDVIVDTTPSQAHLWERLGRESADLILLSRSLIPHPPLETVRLLRGIPESPAVAVLGPALSAEEQADFLAAGCDAVLSTDLPVASIAKVVKTVLDKRRALADRGLIARRPIAQPRLTDFVSASPAMQTFMNVVRRVVPTDVSLLVLGETGVGKERLARAIHAEGSRTKGPFIAVNCGALPESLLESELFGHEEGAFTGATRSRRGWFELAHGGTIFLDEIAEVPLHLQVKLLRVLQEHEIQRVGSERHIIADVRVIAATNRNLEDEVRAGRFRRDLYYRLSVVSLTIPALRERREDIAELVESYVGHLRPRVGRAVARVAPEALDALIAYDWPGNVRELINVVERAMLLSENDEISLRDLPVTIARAASGANTPFVSSPAADAPIEPSWLERPLAEVRDEAVLQLERAYLAGLLRETGGRIGETAERAGIQPRSLYEKMKRLGLRKEDFKRRPPRARTRPDNP